MHRLVWVLLLILLVLHQDYWNWGSETELKLVFGFIPYSLAYHCCISVAASIAWVLVVRFCWPTHLLQEMDLPGDEVSQS